MRSRTFLHVSLGILALVIAYNLGARSATAQPTMQFIPQGYTVFIGGQGWAISTTGWYPLSASDLPPVALSSLAALSGSHAITQSGECWLKYNGGEWMNMGVPPGSPTPARVESFGAVKARYR